MTEHREEVSPALHKLRALPQWVCWRREQRKGKSTKVPYDPKTRRLAESDNPATWGSYEQAVQAWQAASNRFDGIGFVFAPKGEITGIDLDHCVNADGTIDAWARRIVETLESYSEHSPSQTGIHILVHGTIPKGIRRKAAGAPHPEAAIEMYCMGRYFTMTTSHVPGTPEQIEERQEALSRLYEEITRKAPPQREAPAPLFVSTVLSPDSHLVDDDSLIQKACAAGNGDKFRALFYQGAAGYASASEADMALCVLLAFWTGRDTARMDRLFRKSALYREKWDSARSSQTYGRETVEKAAGLCQVVYTPRHTQQQLERDITRLIEQVAKEQARSGGKSTRPFQLTPQAVDVNKVLEYLGMNEYGDALFFARVFEGQVCYDHTNGEWYLWQGHFWKQDTTGKVRQLIAGVLGSLYLRAAADLNTQQAELDLKIKAQQREDDPSEQVEALKGRSKALAGQMSELAIRAKGLRSAKRNNSVQTFIQSEVGITADQWDIHPWMLPVQNGVIDLRNGICHEGYPDDYIRTVAPTEWTGLETPSPRFKQFLQEIFEDKADREAFITFLQRLLGYGITGLTTLHLFPIFYGAEGRNGKDTLLSVLQAVLGKLVGPVSNDVFIAQDRQHAGGAATPHLCDLQGKRLVWGSETKEGDRLNIAQIKLLTGGGDISTRQLHGRQYNFVPTHKLLLMTNYKPHADARDKAFWSRACLIEFGIRFVDRPQAPNERQADSSLKEALKQENSGILAWLVQGCLAWQREGLAIPESVRLSTDQYRNEEDKMLQFIQERCLVTSNASARASSLYDAYRKWSEDNQYGKGMNSRLFGEEMKKRFARIESNGKRIYQGIGLLIHEEDLPPLFQTTRVSRGSVEGPLHPSTSSKTASEANSQEREKEMSRGSVEGPLHPSTLDKMAPEANLQEREKEMSRGCRGSQQVFAQNVSLDPVIGTKTMQNPLHPLLSPSSVINKAASEAILQTNKKGGGPSTDPLLSQPSVINKAASEAGLQERAKKDGPSTDPLLLSNEKQCSTRWEKPRKVRHEAVGTHFSLGCRWCERCVNQRLLIEIGARIDYPALTLSYQGKASQVRAGREHWLKLACDGGYALVEHALQIAQREETNNADGGAL